MFAQEVHTEARGREVTREACPHPHSCMRSTPETHLGNHSTCVFPRLPPSCPRLAPQVLAPAASALMLSQPLRPPRPPLQLLESFQPDRKLQAGRALSWAHAGAIKPVVAVGGRHCTSPDHRGEACEGHRRGWAGPASCSCRQLPNCAQDWAWGSWLPHDMTQEWCQVADGQGSSAGRRAAPGGHRAAGPSKRHV